jgi:hypothetical protein
VKCTKSPSGACTDLKSKGHPSGKSCRPPRPRRPGNPLQLLHRHHITAHPILAHLPLLTCHLLGRRPRSASLCLHTSPKTRSRTQERRSRLVQAILALKWVAVQSLQVRTLANTFVITGTTQMQICATHLPPYLWTPILNSRAFDDRRSTVVLTWVMAIWRRSANPKARGPSQQDGPLVDHRQKVPSHLAQLFNLPIHQIWQTNPTRTRAEAEQVYCPFLTSLAMTRPRPSHLATERQ